MVSFLLARIARKVTHPRVSFAPLFALLLFIPAHAQETYLDDRSSPKMLIRSLYNAINRKEFARAHGYFNTPPAASFAAYRDGFRDTGAVQLVTGTATMEGAAGSRFYHLPVALRATMVDGSMQIFAGCYMMRLAEPQIQEPPFQPLSIEEATLQRVTGTLDAVLPDRCGNGDSDTAASQDRALARAVTRFSTAYEDHCAVDDRPEPEDYPLTFSYPHDSPDMPARQVRLYRFLCDRGAYNETHVYLLADEDGAVQPVGFAVPELEIDYQHGNSEGPVDAVRIVGYATEHRLVNSTFDAETLTIRAHDKWRGVGDAFADGVWLFRSGRFTLVRYEVDAAFDGAVEPVTLLDYLSGP